MGSRVHLQGTLSALMRCEWHPVRCSLSLRDHRHQEQVGLVIILHLTAWDMGEQVSSVTHPVSQDGHWWNQV